MKIILDLEETMKKVEQANAELQTNMKMKVQKMKEMTEKICHEIMESNVKMVIEEKEDEFRLLKLQMAKQRRTEEEEDAEKQLVVKKEVEFQNSVYRQTHVQAVEAERRTRAACSANASTMHCYIGSLDNIQSADKYIDEQAEAIVSNVIDEKDFASTKGCRQWTKDALQDGEIAQERRVLDNINMKRTQQFAETSTKKFGDIDEDFEQRFAQSVANKTPQRQERDGSNHSTFVKVQAGGGGYDSEDGDFGFFAYYIIFMNKKQQSEYDDDEPGDNGPGGNGGVRNSNGDNEDGKATVIQTQNATVQIMKFAPSVRIYNTT